MVRMMSSADRTGVDLEEASRPYHGWHPRGSEVAGSKAFAQPPLCVHRSRSGTLRSVRMSKDIEPMDDRSYGRIL